MESSQPKWIIVIIILWVKIYAVEPWKLLLWCGYSIFGFSGIVFCIVMWFKYRIFVRYCIVLWTVGIVLLVRGFIMQWWKYLSFGYVLYYVVVWLS